MIRNTMKMALKVAEVNIVPLSKDSLLEKLLIIFNLGSEANKKVF